MKSELCTIKQDFEKLIRKEITLKPQNGLSNSNSKAKYCSSGRKEVRSTSEYDKYNGGTVLKDSHDHFNRIINL